MYWWSIINVSQIIKWFCIKSSGLKYLEIYFRAMIVINGDHNVIHFQFGQDNNYIYFYDLNYYQ